MNEAYCLKLFLLSVPTSTVLSSILCEDGEAASATSHCRETVESAASSLLAGGRERWKGNSACCARNATTSFAIGLWRMQIMHRTCTSHKIVSREQWQKRIPRCTSRFFEESGCSQGLLLPVLVSIARRECGRCRATHRLGAMPKRPSE